MKSIRKTTAKTRKGVLNWLSKLNPLNHTQSLDDSDAVAVHIDRYTGAIVSWEMPDGSLRPAPVSVVWLLAA